MIEQTKLLRNLPKVDELLHNEQINRLMSKVSRQIVVKVIRDKIDDVRQKILNDTVDQSILNQEELDIDAIIKEIVNSVEGQNEMSLRKVINATGTILHTNLGRALISQEVQRHLCEIASNYTTLEYDVEAGKRGTRYAHVEKLLMQLTGAEAALVVNNNAAAVMLILSTIAKDKEVIVSRGELVEIGGSFRIPEIMEQSGAVLKEVGTTNKTHFRDYSHAIDMEKTGALLKVHTSNYRIMGFTDEVGLKELAELGKANGVPVIHDLGSGSLVELKEYGIFDEPTVKESIDAEVDIISFSGDKLLGGPQAGIIIGKKEWINKMKKNPLTRALRIDKLTLAALEGTLRLYLSDDVTSRIPTLKMMTETKEVSMLKAEKVFNGIKNCQHIQVQLIEGFSQIGGGSLPLHQLPSWIVEIKPIHYTVNELEKVLREGSIPVITRIHKDAILIDTRTIEEESIGYVIDAILETRPNLGVNQ